MNIFLKKLKEQLSKELDELERKLKNCDPDQFVKIEHDILYIKEQLEKIK